MNKIIITDQQDWRKYLSRPTLDLAYLEEKVSEILSEVKRNGNKALIRYSQLFDQVELPVIENVLANKELYIKPIEPKLEAAVQIAIANIKTFHTAQKTTNSFTETMPGIACWRKAVPIDSVGLYIPGGTAPLFSTLIMLAVPALIAGCGRIVVCTPPQSNGTIHPVILYVAKLLGIKELYPIGGAQSIAALAYGTESIAKVMKIFGPGNQYVTKAKSLVQRDGVAIDMPAGPSEVLIIADEHTNPEFIAADLLAQAEHGADSQVILLSNSESIIDKTLLAIKRQISLLPRKNIAQKALLNSVALVMNSIQQCFEFSNEYAPEHLMLHLYEAEKYEAKITNAGSVFVGEWSCETAGDYASGTNHTLPTNGYAKNYSGVSLDSFLKQITFQKLTQEGLKEIAPTLLALSSAESLAAHEAAVKIRIT